MTGLSHNHSIRLTSSSWCTGLRTASTGWREELLRQGVKFVYTDVSFVPLLGTCLFHDLAAYLSEFGLRYVGCTIFHYASK
jgi:hypothetical protein